MSKNSSNEAIDTHFIPGRRRFLSYVPAGIIAAITGTMAVVAFRYLRPINRVNHNNWSDLGPVTDLKGTKPILKMVVIDQEAGWSTTKEEHFVYVLPGETPTVLSSACPHEGCNVAWNDGVNGFTCPCHDSLFGPDGSRVKGPARRGLDPFPMREQDGRLQIQYLTYVNNLPTREVRE